METLNEKEATSVSIDTVHSPEMTLFTLPLNSLQNTTVSHLTNAESVRTRIAPTTSTGTIPQQEMASIHPTQQITIMSDEIINASYDHESSELNEELKKYVVFKKY
ncbi:unnamed protein product [Colias eurytheme]|nr:unnamed protein product [Colias eurytheme]